MSNLIVRKNHPLSVLGDLDRMMDSVFWGRDSQTGGSHHLTVDVIEEESRYLLNADIPGFGEKDVDIKVDDQSLTISGTMEENKEDEKKGSWLIKERRNASFFRTFNIPGDVEKDNISAKISNGVLSIDLPKSPKAKPRSVDIKKA